MSVRDELVQAFERNNELAVRRLGWAPVYEAASTWWLPRQPLTMPGFVHYAKALGNEDPDVVLAAFREVAGEWRPTVGALLSVINRKRDEQGGRDRHPGNPATTPDALAAVRAAVAAGETPCSCGAPTSKKWRPDRVVEHICADGRKVHIPFGVWRCPDCHGIEQGQVNAMEDEPLERQEVAAA